MEALFLFLFLFSKFLHFNKNQWALINEVASTFCTFRFGAYELARTPYSCFFPNDTLNTAFGLVWCADYTDI